MIRDGLYFYLGLVSSECEIMKTYLSCILSSVIKIDTEICLVCPLVPWQWRILKGYTVKCCKNRYLMNFCEKVLHVGHLKMKIKFLIPLSWKNPTSPACFREINMTDSEALSMSKITLSTVIRNTNWFSFV